MSAATASKVFLNYTKTQTFFPRQVWAALRALGLTACLAVIVMLFLKPRLGLVLFWGLAVPVFPAATVLAPGFWRQVCPMALLNQIPRMAGRTLGRDLPDGLRDKAFTIAVALFFAAVALRAPVLNADAVLLAAGLCGALALAFLGGVIFKGRSGWCGTFCPLGPIQRDYGHAPLLVVANGYCPTCLGCQKNCYDFSPKAAVFGDVYDEDPRYAGQRRFFMAMMPGMVLGYFAQGPAQAYGEPRHLLILVAATAASVGLYQAAVSFFALNPFRAANLFAGAALALFYVYAGPTILASLGALFDFSPPAALQRASETVGLALAGVLILQGRRNERAYLEAAGTTGVLQIGGGAAALRDRLAEATAGQARERSSGAIFPVAPGQSLLEAMERAGVKINYGCRSGLCGADAVAVCEGGEHLSQPSEEEQATLRRLGLEGRARLACVCQVQGPIVIDVDLAEARARPAPPSARAACDYAAEQGIRKVVVLGNGVAGLGVAEALRSASASVEIAVVAEEPHHFYNRMAIGRAIHGRASMEGLYLLPDAWYAERRVDVWRNTLATAIDRDAKKVLLGTGEALDYDRLVFATGARAAYPAPTFKAFANAFVLRTAADAQAIRARAQSHGARRAVVLGGGVLGVEAADALRKLGLHTTILQRADRLMDRQLDAKGAARLAAYLENMGVAVRTGVAVEAFEGVGVLTALRLASGERIEADLFVASTGTVPNAELARACGLDVGRGVKVDAFMRSSDPEIYAVGDVAELAGAASGLWTVGAAQAATAAASILGAPRPYAPPPLIVQLKCDGVDLRSFGEVEPRDGDETFCAPAEEAAWWRLVVREGGLAGAVFVGPPGTAREFTKALKSGADVDALLASLGA